MVTLAITGGPTIQFAWSQNMNGQSALEAAYNTLHNPQSFTFQLQYYGTSLGYLVDMINGTFDTALSTDAPYFFWDFIVNGVESQNGIDSTPINDSDVITFTYKMYEPEIHANTRMHSKYLSKLALN